MSEPTNDAPASPPRLARVYEGRDLDGRPIIDRDPIDPTLTDALLTYLESAPIVLAARSFDVDEFAPADRDVPLNYRTDGTWIWAGSVPHYLRKHGLAPEPKLVRHIQARGFELGPVDETTKDRAVSVITGS
ncbi:hypothetical protein [Nocardia macrotermitis]|uniref:Uncharacterized protein n=1 Tax=Nocardia macrotermitis TaxID=2585198 RepID=A0A7K0DBH0_9NOCA|nr:hypothetical protein [Nocardia macrotermitis]MQY23135.1 hypothetical protein [Nocardia macrotermitis]